MKKYLLLILFLLFSSLSFSKDINFEIKTIRVTCEKFVYYKSFYGYVRPVKKEVVLSYSDGIIKQIFVKDGELVKKGQELFSIEGYYNLLDGENKKKSYIIIKSPINGIISLKKELGDSVGKNEILAKVMDTKKFFINVTLYNKNVIKSLRVAQSAEVEIDGNKLKGQVYSISKVASDNKKGFKVKLYFVNKNNMALYYGMTESVKVVIDKGKKTVGIPKRALLEDNGKTYVMVKSNNQYEKREVKTGIRTKDSIQILKGLKSGETVVTDGAYELFNRDINKRIKVAD